VLLLEHEGKALLGQYDIPIPRGMVVARGELPPPNLSGPVMIKAQVPIGARGKAGGIRSVDRSADLPSELASLFQAPIRAHKVETVLIEEKIAFRHERYLAILIEGEDVLLVIGRAGGIEVEQLALGNRGNFRTVKIDVSYGLGEHQVRTALEDLGIPARLWPGYVQVAMRLARLLRECDATLAEINPLAEREDGSLIALDARINVDPGAFFRQPRFAEIEKGRISNDNLAEQMKKLEIQYVPLGGSVGLLSSGAGVGVTIMDWVALEGESLASFVDIDYAIMSGQTKPAIRLVLNVLEADPNVRAIIVNFTSCGLRLDSIAEMLRDVLAGRADFGKPIALHLQGNRAEAAHRMLRESGFPVIDKLGDAVRYAVRAARKPL
jgi:succinyl-CoA synthetase beta subunit